jgi:hypothetical protein
MGVGSTGVAAIEMGRKFIGFEIAPEYFVAAEKRIKHAHMQQSLFAEEFMQNEAPKKEGAVLKPIIKWPGGKEKELPHIKLHAPQWFDNYYEPFVGGGSVFTALDAKHLYINDKSNELISLYQYIASQDKIFFQWLDLIMQAWQNTLDYVAQHKELCEWYKQFRCDEIDELLMKGKKKDRVNEIKRKKAKEKTIVTQMILEKNLSDFVQRMNTLKDQSVYKKTPEQRYKIYKDLKRAEAEKRKKELEDKLDKLLSKQ